MKLTKEEAMDKVEIYLENARTWIFKAKDLADKYNVETDHLASLTCEIDDSIAEVKEE